MSFSLRASAWIAHLDTMSGKLYYTNDDGNITLERPESFIDPKELQLDPQWFAIYDANTQRYYYANRDTYATSWEIPKDLKLGQYPLSFPSASLTSPAQSPSYNNNNNNTHTVSPTPEMKHPEIFTYQPSASSGLASATYAHMRSTSIHSPSSPTVPSSATTGGTTPTITTSPRTSLHQSTSYTNILPSSIIPINEHHRPTSPTASTAISVSSPHAPDLPRSRSSFTDLNSNNRLSVSSVQLDNPEISIPRRLSGNYVYNSTPAREISRTPRRRSLDSISTVPILPEDLRADIALFSMDGFAASHFRNQKRKVGLVSKRACTVAEIVSWQKPTIQKSLLMDSKKYSGAAVNAFKLIQQFMGDISLDSAYKNRTSPQLQILQDLLNLDKSSKLTDEIYAQLCKQTRLNPDVKSTTMGWRLFACLCHLRTPSISFRPFVLSHISESRFSVNANKEQLIIIPFVFWRIHRTSWYGADTLSLVDLWDLIEKIAFHGINSLTVSFPGILSYIVEVQHEESVTYEYPQVLKLFCDAIRNKNGFYTEGIFRVAGQKAEIDKIQQGIDRGDLDVLDYADVFAVADALKLWLRQLVEPVIPFPLYDRCVTSSESTDECLVLLLELPLANRATLMYLLEFLAELVTFSHLNLMTSENLGIVFSPTLLRSNGPVSTNIQAALLSSAAEKTFIKRLIDNIHYIKEKLRR